MVLSDKPFDLKIGKLEIFAPLSYGLCTLLGAGVLDYHDLLVII